MKKIKELIAKAIIAYGGFDWDGEEMRFENHPAIQQLQDHINDLAASLEQAYVIIGHYQTLSFFTEAEQHQRETDKLDREYCKMMDLLNASRISSYLTY